MFRDEKVAHHERELAELRDKLEAERDRAAKAEAEAAKARAEADEAQMERKMKGGWFKQWLDRRAEEKAARREMYGSYYRPRSRFGPISWLHVIIGGFIVLALGLSIYHYCTDIQEGVVTGRDYHPPRTTCSTDSDGHTSCHTTPEYWTVDIAFEGQSATWTVSHSEYERTRYGDWFCYTDIFHSQDNCHGRPR